MMIENYIANRTYVLMAFWFGWLILTGGLVYHFTKNKSDWTEEEQEEVSK